MIIKKTSKPTLTEKVEDDRDKRILSIVLLSSNMDELLVDGGAMLEHVESLSTDAAVRRRLAKRFRQPLYQFSGRLPSAHLQSIASNFLICYDALKHLDLKFTSWACFIIYDAHLPCIAH